MDRKAAMRIYQMSHFKRCIKCGRIKPLGDFYGHPQMKDGHLNKCKECTKLDVSWNYKKNRAYFAEYEKNRSQRPERKAKAIEYQRNRRANNPEQYKAHCIVNNAIRDRKLIPQPCEICGTEPAQAHHPDYSKPLEVQWLCRVHHLQKHGKVSYEQIMEMFAREDEQYMEEERKAVNQ